MRSRRYLGNFFLMLLAIAALLALYRQQAIADWFRLRNYQPPPAIASLADSTAMTDAARHLFYINHPSLEDKPTFRKNCPDYGEQTIVIGCYLGGQRGIHLLSVDDERLAGVEEVTAAHEMLHAAYERLGGSERRRIDGLLQAYADKELKDERILKALESYRTTEPGEELNEMHSMFGTEIAKLPADLETYYAKYFTSRQSVVAFAQRYQDAFASRQAAIKQYDRQLAAEAKRIRSNTEQLEAKERRIAQLRQQLDADRQSGDIEAYNAGVEPFNALVGDYNRLLAETKDLITSYNAMVEARNAIAVQTVELQKAISSSSLPASE